MGQITTYLTDAVSVLEVDEGIFIRDAATASGGRLALSEAGAINLLLWFKEHRPDLVLDVVQS
jgi:hypothetical protein